MSIKRLHRNYTKLRQFINLFAVGLLLIGMATVFMAMVTSPKASAAPPITTVAVGDVPDQCVHTFFGLIPWYQYLGDSFHSSVKLENTKQPCTVKCFNILVQDAENDCGYTHSDVPLVLLAIIDDLLRIAGIVAFIFLIYGGLQYVASQGNPDGMSKAQQTIAGALIGVAIATIAVVLISYIGNKLGG